MLDYQTLDNIADAYTPALLFTCLLLIAQSCVKKKWQKATKQTALLMYGIVLTYSLMFVDQYLKIWPSFELDYSTHSAAALVLVVFLINSLSGTKLFWLFSLLSYFLLMLYQHYHSLTDIITTSLVILVFMLPVSHKLAPAFNTSPTGKL
jgi:hypothetical protein